MRLAGVARRAVGPQGVRVGGGCCHIRTGCGAVLAGNRPRLWLRWRIRCWEGSVGLFVALSGGWLRSGDRAVFHDGFPSCENGGVSDPPRMATAYARVSTEDQADKGLGIAAQIDVATTEGDLVIDPAAGTFSVLDACRQKGRVFLGCDLNG